MTSRPRGRRGSGPATTKAEQTKPTDARIEKVPGKAPASPLALEPTGAPYRRPVRPPYGSGPDAWEAEFGQQGAVILTPDMEVVGLAIALTAARALDGGVPVCEILLLSPTRWAATDEAGAGTVVMDRDHEARAAEQSIAQLDRQAAHARRNAQDSRNESNRRHFLHEADAAAENAEKLRRQVTEIRVRPIDAVALPALARTDPVVLALVMAARPEPAPDLAQAFAVQQVIRDLCLVPDGLLVRGSFRLAVPTRDRLLVLGPIEFTLPNRCRNGVAVYLQQADFTTRSMAPALRSRSQRQELLERLQAAPCSLPKAAAATAAEAFFAAVPSLLLGEESGELAKPWNDPRWAAHLRRTYRRRGRGRVRGPWLTVSPARQALSFAIADAGRPLTRDQVIDVLERHGASNPAGRTHQYTVDHRDAHARDSTSWSWPPAVLRSGRGGTWRAWLRPCPRCEAPAELVVRTPELPFGCMCRCGGAPGLPPDLTVPRSYRLLVPRREWLPGYADALRDLADLRASRVPS